MHKNSPAAAYVQTCFFPFSLCTCLSAFTELPSLTHLLLQNYSKSGRDNVAVVISCISQHQHHTFSFLLLKRWDSITCCWDFSILRSRVFAGEPASRMTLPPPPPSSPSTPFHFAVASVESAGSDLSMHQLAGSAGLQGPVWKRAEIHNDQSLRLTE